MTAYPALRAAGATDVGRVREVNEDSFVMLPAVAVVADGMGGHASGDVASALAVETFQSRFATICPVPEDIQDAVHAANSAITSEAARHSEKQGMGTTLTGVALVESEGAPHWLVFNVGDSRVYRLSPAGVTQVTIDHSEVAVMVQAGMITAAEARVHPLRNVITRSLGTYPSPEADTWLMAVSPDDMFLLCSDGLTGELEDHEIHDIASRTLGVGGSIDNLAQRLVDAAVASGGRDNVTVVLVTPPPSLFAAPAETDVSTSGSSRSAGDVSSSHE